MNCYRVGHSICHSNQCYVVVGTGAPDVDLTKGHGQVIWDPEINIMYRPMTWLELIKHKHCIAKKPTTPVTDDQLNSVVVAIVSMFDKAGTNDNQISAALHVSVAILRSLLNEAGVR